MNIIEYIIRKKEILEDLEAAEKFDRDYDMIRAKYAKLKLELEEQKKELEYLTTRQTKNLKTIKKLRKELKEAKNDNKI